MFIFSVLFFSISRSESWTWLIAAVLKMLYQPQRSLIRSSFLATRSFPRTSHELWIQFLSCDITCMKSFFVCYKHFDDIHLNKGDIKEFVLPCIAILLKSQEFATKTQVPRKLPKISISWWGLFNELQK